MSFSVKTAMLGVVFSIAASAAFAQESTNQVGANTDWYVFEEAQPTKQCWIVSKPKETVNTDSSGRIKSVRRGEILLFVSYAPASGVKGQVSFAGGYPFASGSEVTLEIGGTDYPLFTEGETGWAATPEDDQRIIAAMKRGAAATLTGRSARGTVTKDTFSLLGFTASVEEAAKRCGS
ncbi:invasion associated locus B family protein [Celeribacter arenosi]|uniref:Invasion associated locus B family protein n=1 Tax=Celeribacter arenosi TaxID=792649 RepID=A0ABP7K0I7_9RHOB